MSTVNERFKTIRKDLEFLQRKGILFRTHGGAVLRN